MMSGQNRAWYPLSDLVLFGGSIILVGLPIFSPNRTLWLVTVVVNVVLVGSSV